MSSDALARRLLVATLVGSLLLVSAAVAFVLLAKRPSTPPRPVEAVPPVETTVTAPPAAEPVKARPAGPTGRLTIEVRPTSTIRIDGKTVGRGHYTGHVRAGSHLIDLRTVDGRKMQERLDVEANGATSFCWDFDANAECSP